MSTPIVVALIASVGSVLVTLGNLAWTARANKQERRLAARAELDRYREPLLSAVDELGNRIDNIRNRGFFSYLNIEERKDFALQSTLFRVAQYFGWVEILYGYSGHLRFASDKKTRTIADTLGWIASTLADDRYDQVVGDDVTSAQLVIWREEQRAIGELMRRNVHTPACIGYNTFVDSYHNHFLKWFATFVSQLQAMYAIGAIGSPGSPPKSERLDQLHALLAKLLAELDVAKAVTEFKNGRIEKPKWAQPCRFTKLRTVEEVIAQRTLPSSYDAAPGESRSP